MKFEITILGSGSALPTLQRNTTAQLVNIRENYFLVDCGEGVQLQMQKYKIAPSKINHIFISHLHGDHYLGLMGFLTSQNLLGRTNELHLYANSRLKEIIDLQMSVSDSKFNFPFYFHSLNYENKNLIYENKSVQVYSFPMKHRIPVCGFLFQEKKRELRLNKDALKDYKVPVKMMASIKSGEDFIDEKGKHIKNEFLTLPFEKTFSYAFCTDTKYYPKITEFIKEVHTIFHEATFIEKDKDKAKKTYHSTALQAAKIAKDSLAQQLVLGHFSVRYKGTDVFLNEAKLEFENTIIANDGNIIKLY